MRSESGDLGTIQWFPGHMMKTLRLMAAEMKNVDIVLQLLDARIPFSSLNPEIEKLCAAKPRLYVLNKADLADPAVTAQWVRFFHAQNAGCVEVSCKSKAGFGTVKKQIDREVSDIVERRALRGMQNAKIRIMVTGIPNVGKSTFINAFAGNARAQTADRPGVTRGKQWIACSGYDLLDMPGVLWKKFDSMVTAANLAFIGSISDGVLDMEEIACALLSEVKRMYPDLLCSRYKLEKAALEEGDFTLLESIAKKRGCLLSGGVIDTERAAILLCDEFRSSRLGRISLERPV